MPRYRVTITSTDREAMLDLVRKHNIQVFDHGNRYSAAGGYSVDALAEATEIRRLKKAGYQLEQHEDADKLGKERQREVSRGDRYAKQDEQ